MRVPTETPLLEYMTLAWRWKWFISMPSLLGLAVGLFLLSVLPKGYTAVATVGKENTDATQLEPKNERVNYAAVKIAQVRLQMDDFAIPVTRKALGLAADATPTSFDVKRVRNTLSLEFLGDLIYFKAIGPDPQFVAKVAEAYAELFVLSNSQKQETLTGQFIEFYEKEMKEQKAALDAITEKIAAYRDIHRGSLPEDVQSNRSEILRLQDDLTRAEPELQARRTEREALATLLKTPAGQTLPQTLANDPALRLQTLRLELAELRGRLTEKHPDVQNKKRDIALLEQAMAAAGPAGRPQDVAGAVNPAILSDARMGGFTYEKLVSLDREITSLEGRIENYRREIDRRRSEMAGADRVAVGYTPLTRERDRLDGAYRALSENRQKTLLNQNLTADLSVSLYKILARAQIPTNPSSPIPLVLLAMGLGIGLAAGAGLAVLMEQFRQTYTSAEHIKSDLGVPVLGTITRMGHVRKLGKRVRYRRNAV